jgi:hypothetical protein
MILRRKVWRLDHAVAAQVAFEKKQILKRVFFSFFFPIRSLKFKRLWNQAVSSYGSTGFNVYTAPTMLWCPRVCRAARSTTDHGRAKGSAEEGAESADESKPLALCNADGSCGGGKGKVLVGAEWAACVTVDRRLLRFSPAEADGNRLENQLLYDGSPMERRGPAAAAAA